MRPFAQCTATLLSFAEDDAGYPRMDFEAWYQMGLQCFVWGLPRPLVRQAFRRLCRKFRSLAKPISMWQVRTFVWACNGADAVEQRKVPESYRWPSPPDTAWEVVVCVYPDGGCELDMVHPVSRCFWSEDNGFFDLPSDDRSLINRRWFEKMGFDIMTMTPDMLVRGSEQIRPHLRAVI